MTNRPPFILLVQYSVQYRQQVYSKAWLYNPVIRTGSAVQLYSWLTQSSEQVKLLVVQDTVGSEHLHLQSIVNKSFKILIVFSDE